MIGDGTEYRKCANRPFLGINMVVKVTVSYGCSRFSGKCSWCNIFAGIFLGYETLHSWMDSFRDECNSFRGKMFEEWRKRILWHVSSEVVPVGFRGLENRSMERHIRGYPWFDFDFDTEYRIIWSTQGSGNISAKHFSWHDVKKSSRMCYWIGNTGVFFRDLSQIVGGEKKTFSVCLFIGFLWLVAVVN